MIKQICDLCASEINILDSVVLHETCFDFCENCKYEASEILKIDREIYKEEYEVFKKKLKEREKKLLKGFSK